MFIQPVGFTVKKDQKIKIALNARSLNNAILQNKYQMPNLEGLMEIVAEIVNDNKGDELSFMSLDMQYAYGQTILHP